MQTLMQPLGRSLRPGMRVAGGLTTIYQRATLDLRFAQQKRLDSRITFTRASSGTYVGSDGLIKTATTNLLLRSEEFGTWWTPLRASVSSNAAVAPNGLLTADKLVEDTTASNSHAVYSGGTQGAGTYTISVYAKAAERSRLFIAQESGGNSLFTLSGAGTASATGANTVSITNVGDGWYRCTSTYTATGAHFIYLQTHNGTSNIYTGDGTSGLFIWGAQLEQSSTVGEYIPTTSTINSAPRFDHNPTTGESLGLLVEEQRTNLAQQSADISNAYWTKSETTVTANSIASPDGSITAGKLVESTANGQHTLASAAITWAGNTQYTATFYAKAGERFNFDILLGTGGNWVNSERVATFNLNTGTVLFSPQSPAVASIQAVGNGWYKCRITATTVASPSASSVFIRMADSAGLASYQGITGNGLYLWGAQLEAGSFPTSYIPTTSATVTRSADVASITGANFSTWYRQDEGTVFAEFQTVIQDAANNRGVTAVDDGTNNNRVSLFIPAGNFPLAVASRVVSGGVATNPTNTGSITSSSIAKSAICYRVGTDGAAVSVNGAIPAASSPASAPNGVNNLRIGTIFGTNNLGGTIRRLTYWPSRLPNSTLQEITR